MLDLLRVFAYVVILIAFYNFPFVSALLNCIMIVSYLIMFLIVRPIVNKMLLVIRIGIEISLVIVFLLNVILSGFDAENIFLNV